MSRSPGPASGLAAMGAGFGSSFGIFSFVFANAKIRTALAVWYKLNNIYCSLALRVPDKPALDPDLLVVVRHDHLDFDYLSFLCFGIKRFVSHRDTAGGTDEIVKQHFVGE